MDKDLLLLLQDIAGEELEELEEKETEEMEDRLRRIDQKEFQAALQTFFDEREELPNSVNRAAAVLTKIIIAIAAEIKEEKKPGEGVKKSYPSWSFTLKPEEED